LSFAAFFAVGSAWLLGTLAVGAVWPRSRALSSDMLLIAPLGIGVGLGLSSVLFFFASLASDHPVAISMAGELVISVAFAGLLLRGSRDAESTSPIASPVSPWLPSLIATIFIQACVVAGVVSIRSYQAEPYGSWDGWAIWNMHARLIFRGGKEWSTLLQQPQIAWSHLDYPLLIPASVARVWAFAGDDTPFGSGLVSGAFGIGTVWLLVASVGRLRRSEIALTGGLLLLGTPFFVTFSSNEHADIPVGFFILSALVMIALSEKSPNRGYSALVGIGAGMAAWTKNEGLMFALVITIIYGVAVFRHSSKRTFGFFLLGLLGSLLPVFYFKMALAPPNDVASEGMVGRLGYLFDWSRHRLILSSLWRDGTRFGEWRIVPFLAMALPLMGKNALWWIRREWIVAAVLATMVLGYYAVYLLTPWDLAWHLDSSLVRLLLQLWPAGVFLWCLAIPQNVVAAVVSPSRVQISKHRIIAFALVNLMLGGGCAFLLSHQLASNEMAAGHSGGVDVHAIIGDGWFGREKDHRNTWVWSSGKSSLRLKVAGGKAVALTFDFRIRGIEKQIVSALVEGRVVWRDQISEQLRAVEIANLTLQPGENQIVFVTDSPGVAESAAPAARVLTFALYDIRLK
jgi:Dolichyl-phosphate-mannose-protein mannosyltransferase